MESMFTSTRPAKADLLPPCRRIITGHDDEGQAIFEDDRRLEPFSPRRVSITASLPSSPTVPRHQIHHPPSYHNGSSGSGGSDAKNGKDEANLKKKNGGGAGLQGSDPGTPYSESAQLAMQELGDALPRDGRQPAPEGSFINLFRTEGFPAAVQGPWTEHNGKAIPLCDSIGTTVRIVDMPPGATSPMHRTQSIDFGVVLKGQVVLELDEGEKTVCEGDVVVQRGTIHAWHNRTSAFVRMLFVLVPSEAPVVNGETLEPCGFDLLQRGRFDEFQFDGNWG
jgi:quercetin dioxygenase-like cupin family protein